MINTAVKAGHINMGRLLRQMSRHTNQSRKMVYHRPPVFGKDNYGVETTSQSTAEIVLPELPCLIRPAMTADYALERAGVNIIGGARIYTPNIKNIKGFANFNPLYLVGLKLLSQLCLIPKLPNSNEILKLFVCKKTSDTFLASPIANPENFCSSNLIIFSGFH